MPNPRLLKKEPLPDFDKYTVDFDTSERPQCFHLFWKDVEVATIRLEFDATGYLNKAIREGTRKQRNVSLKDLTSLPFFSLVTKIQTVDAAKTDHRWIKGVDLIDPTVEACLPISVENVAIAYDLENDSFKVVQPDETLLKATVTQAEKDREIKVRDENDAPIYVGYHANDAPMPVATRSGESVLVEIPDSADRALGWVSGSETLPMKQKALTGELQVDAFQSDASKLKATVTQASIARTVTGTLTQSTKHDAQTFLSARIDTATGASNVEVVAAQGVGKKIYVMGYQLQGKGDVEAVLRSASTDLSPEWDFNAREGVVAPPCVWPEFYFVTAANEALNIYLDAAIRVTGNVQYVVNT